MGKRRPDDLLGHRRDEPLVRDDAGDQMCRSNIERGIVNLNALRGGLPAEAMRDFAPIALLDGDGIAGWQAQVERAGGGGYMEGNPAAPRQTRATHRPALVARSPV